MNPVRTKNNKIESVITPEKLNISNGVNFKLKTWLIAVAIISMVLVVNYVTLAWTEPVTNPPISTGFARYSLDAHNGSITNAVYVDDTGNVGIGTMIPQVPLHTVLNTNNINGLQEVGRFTAQTSGTASFNNPAFGSGVFLYSEHVNGGVYPMAYVGGVISSAAINTGMLSFGNYELGVRTERLLQTGNTVFLKSPYVSVSNGDMTPGANGRYYDGTNNQFEVLKSYAATAGLQSTMGIIAYSDGTADDTFGTSLIFANEGSAGLTYRRAYIGSLATGGAGNGALVLGTYNSSVAYERLRINKDGNVGIGTPVPGTKLTVYGATDAPSIQILSGDNAKWTSLAMGRAVTEGFWGIAAAANNYFNGSVAGDMAIRIDSTLNKLLLGIGTGGNPELTIADGNIGIGTANPGQTLHVVRNDNGSDEIARFENQNTGASAESYITLGTPTGAKGGYLGYDYTNSYLFLGLHGALPTLNIKGGNVGIGTLSPSEKLEVTGKVKGSGGSFIIGGTYQIDDNSCCMYANPLTGGCSCPSGFSPYTMTRSRMGCGDAEIGSRTYMCR